MSFVYFLLLVGVLVVIHELGHFVAAKLLDVRVLRFSIGYGRPLFRFKGAETEYQVAIFPLGGYVRILGVEDGEDDDPRDRGRSFQNRPLWQRLLILFAGPAANLLLPIFIYFILFAGQTELPAAVVGDVFEDSPAARAGIAAGDRVLAVDGEGVVRVVGLQAAVGVPRAGPAAAVPQRGLACVSAAGGLSQRSAGLSQPGAGLSQRPATALSEHAAARLFGAAQAAHPGPGPQ